MGIQIQGNSGTIAEVDGTTFRAQRITVRPVDYGAFGVYQVMALSGAMAAGLGAASEILQFRWTDATRLAVIHSLRVTGMRTTTAFAAGAIDLNATIARSFTVAGTGGGTLTMTGNNNKMRTSMGTSLVGEIRVATTAALGAGTKTLDANPLGAILTHSSAGVGAAAPVIGSTYLPAYELNAGAMGDGEAPIVLAQNEGVIVRATVPATGVWNIGFTIKWSEVLTF